MMQAIRWTGALAVVFVATAALQADEAKGTIKSLDTERNEVVLKGLVRDTVYELNKDATVWLDGARCKLTDLKADDKVVINYQKNGEHMKAEQIRCLRKASETTGTVKDVLGDKREIVLKGTVKNTTYELNKDGTVFVDGKKSALTDIREGDQVLVTYEQRGDHYFAMDVTVLKRK